MPAVPLGELVDAKRRRDGEVHRLAARLGERVEMVVRELHHGDVGLRALREAEQDEPGRTGPRSPSRCRRPWRSSAATSREVVLFGSSVEFHELADTEQPRALDYAHEQLCRPVDRLCPGHNHIMEPEFHKRKSPARCLSGGVAADCQDDVSGLLLRFDVLGRLDHLLQRVGPVITAR